MPGHRAFIHFADIAHDRRRVVVRHRIAEDKHGFVRIFCRLAILAETAHVVGIDIQIFRQTFIGQFELLVRHFLDRLDIAVRRAFVVLYT